MEGQEDWKDKTDGVGPAGEATRVFPMPAEGKSGIAIKAAFFRRIFSSGSSHEWRPMPDFSSGIGFKINAVFLRFGS